MSILLLYIIKIKQQQPMLQKIKSGEDNMDKLNMQDLLELGGFNSIKEFEQYLIEKNINALDLLIEDYEAYLVTLQAGNGKKYYIDKFTFKDLSTGSYEKLLSHINNKSNFFEVIEDGVFSYLNSIGITLEIFNKSY